MTFVDMEITRRQFADRYGNVGRVMLADLAEIHGIDFDLAEHWADVIDREHETSAELTPNGADTSGAACIAAPGFSYSSSVGSQDGSDAAAVPPHAAAPGQFPRA
ncbi:hypothetical protein [Sphingobium yanoikuyae]|uniref:Uncharacterized protein n=1 Tax=Sphingopyxis macrogoltabida TaxID=33050 RepID=A0A2W5MQU8_SPHMC|nr:hypothetical protein [Sphingobium yanoikuyae]PZQ20093.1 MAG: hypothetical protein DI569_16570 [Sphingopyxis macrogoltabida]